MNKEQEEYLKLVYQYYIILSPEQIAKLAVRLMSKHPQEAIEIMKDIRK